MPYKINLTTGNLDYYKNTSLTAYVPYTGATTNVDLGAYGITAQAGAFGTASIGNYFSVVAGDRTATIGNFALGTTYIGLSFANTPNSTNYSLLGDGSSITYLNAPTAGTIYYRIGNTNCAYIQTTMYTSLVTNKILNTNPILYLENSGANSSTSGRLEFRSSGGGEFTYFTFDASANAFRHYYGSTESIRVTSTGRVQISAGTAASPALGFYGDTDTGIYSISSNSLGIAAGGGERLKVTASGVGVGGTNPGAGATYLTTPSGQATDANYGWSVQNAIDYIATYFRAPAYSLGGGIYGDGYVNIVSGGNFSNGGSGTPDITIQTGSNYMSNNSGNIYLLGHDNADGGTSASISLLAGDSTGSAAGTCSIISGSATNGYSGGDVYIASGGSDTGAGGLIDISAGTSTSGGGGGNVFIRGGSGAPLGNVQIQEGLAGDTYINPADGNVRILNSSAGYLGFFGATPINQPNIGGAQTAGVVWTATEQAMLQAVYDAMLNYGLGS